MSVVFCGRVVGPKERVHVERAPHGATVHGVDDAADAEADDAEPWLPLMPVAAALIMEW